MDDSDAISEVESIVKEIGFAVKLAQVSHINPLCFSVTIIENAQFELQLTSQGLKVLSCSGLDTGEKIVNVVFETIYAFLDSVSPGYRAAFAGSLCNQLQKIEHK